MNDLSDDTKNFILNKITSVEQINILMLLHLNPTKNWTVAEISEELRSVSTSIQTRLNGLYEGGVLTKPHHHHFRYSPTSEEMSSKIAQLIESYQARPYKVIDLIYSGPSNVLQAFSDAFKIKKDK